MGLAAPVALSWALFSPDLRALHTNIVGLSLFLLVSIRLGGSCLRVAGNRLPQAQDLVEERLAGWFPCCPAAIGGEEATRRQHTVALLEGGFVVRFVLRGLLKSVLWAVY